jgi:hypothetical protein
MLICNFLLPGWRSGSGGLCPNHDGKAAKLTLYGRKTKIMFSSSGPCTKLRPHAAKEPEIVPDERSDFRLLTGLHTVLT